MTEQNGRAEILRAGGFDDAAAFLDAVDQASAMRTVDEVDQPQPPPEPQHQPSAADLVEAQRQAEGRVLLEAAKRDMPDLFREDR